jgi:hypothetical protein
MESKNRFDEGEANRRVERIQVYTYSAESRIDSGAVTWTLEIRREATAMNKATYSRTDNLELIIQAAADRCVHDARSHKLPNNPSTRDTDHQATVCEIHFQPGRTHVSGHSDKGCREILFI